MLGKLLRLAAIAPALLPGCSLILDFSDSAAPHDAALDAPYTKSQCDYKEPNESTDTAAVITTADMGPAAICAPDRDAGAAEDHDFYKFAVTGATKVTVGIQFSNRPGGDLDINLWDATGANKIGTSRGFGNTETIVCPGASPSCIALVDGDYVLEVFPAVSGAVNSYTFSLAIE